MNASAARLTAVVLTRNEEQSIGACLESLRFADARIVVDSASTDRTREIAEAAGARVVVHLFEDYSSQRNFALRQVTTPWVFMVDADERVPDGLHDELLAALDAANSDPATAAMRIRRRNFILGRSPRFSAIGHDHVVRVFRTDRVRYEHLVHEAPVVEGRVIDLGTPMDHFTLTDLGEGVRKTVHYAFLSAQELHARGRRTTLAGIAGHALSRLFKVLIVKRGILAGGRGLIVAGLEAAGVFFKYALLWDLHRRTEDPRRHPR
jgi:glycosyltransferase involved in cell wall biosynthesis